jgi:hypothetical protein
VTAVAEIIRVRDLVDEQIDRHPGAGPDELARAAAELVPEDELREALAVALVDVARKCLSYRQGRLEPTGVNADGRPGVVPTIGERLAMPLCVEPGTWKALQNCRAKDLRKMARWRTRLVHRHAVERRQLEHLADALTEAGEHLVRDLDVAVVEAIFRGEGRPAMKA